jgi:hypothetical protein
MRRSFAISLMACVVALPLAAQTDTVVAGVLGDSSIIAPVVSWNRIELNGDTLSMTLSGWTVSGEMTRRRAPRKRTVASIAITPLNAHSSDRVYVEGARARELEFDAGAVEATYGRIDTIGERWTSDVRFVALYERIDGVDEATRSFWSSPYGGIRTRQTWRRITAEDPLLLTFEGSEVSAMAEAFVGSDTWSRVRLDQRFSRRWGRLQAGESIVAFHGRSLNTVNAFLIGGSWPVADLRPLYGYRYAELRLDRGLGINVDASYSITPSIALGAHAGALRSRDLDARGVAVDVTATWKGIGIRLGAAQPHDNDRREDDVVLYASILAARFIR